MFVLSKSLSFEIISFVFFLRATAKCSESSRSNPRFISSMAFVKSSLMMGSIFKPFRLRSELMIVLTNSLSFRFLLASPAIIKMVS